MSYNKRQLEKKCKHILDYGHNWGFEFVRDSIKWREQYIKEKQKEIKEYQIELLAYKKLLAKMDEKHQLMKLVIKTPKRGLRK